MTIARIIAKNLIIDRQTYYQLLNEAKRVGFLVRGSGIKRGVWRFPDYSALSFENSKGNYKVKVVEYGTL